MFEQDSKLLVVVAVLAIILIAIAIVMFFIDNRLRKAEKKLKDIENKKNRIE